MQNILGFGDANYRYADNLAHTIGNMIKSDRLAQGILANQTDSDDSDEEESDNSDDTEVE
jgi:hypothetical protein